MKNIFSQTKEYVKQPNRNVFDLSFQNNGTYNFGTLYPVFCKEVIPGDSFQIDTQFALRFLPMAFPIQTRMRANLHFFYVRNRNLWDDWKKFIGHTHDTEFPYLDGSQDSIKTGGLADYFGIPTTLVGNYSDVVSTSSSSLWYASSAYAYNLKGSHVSIDPSIIFNGSDLLSNSRVITAPADSEFSFIINPRFVFNCNVSNKVVVHLSSSFTNDLNTDTYLIFGIYDSDGNFYPRLYSLIDGSKASGSDELTFTLIPDSDWYSYDDLGVTAKRFASNSELLDFISKTLGSDRCGLAFGVNGGSVFSNWFGIHASNSRFTKVDVYVSQGDDFTDISSLDSSSNPFVSSNNNGIRLNALPFRAYESIYNAFYRNEQNDPLMINGVPEYDKYCPNTSSGADDFPYRLYQRNWELDFLTSAVQSPQQGIAPLVGVSSAGDFTFVNKDSNGNIGYFTAKANLSSDGSSITGFQLSDKVVLDGIPYTETPNSDVPDDVKRGTVYSLNQMALAGISINDFRNVNALQRWLETNIRRGYKYVDQIKSHFGVDVAYNVLDMPEFIGGVSEPVYINQVNQTTETETDPLGSYAGQASVMAQSSNSVRHYCDEHGFIIGIFSVVPVPNYSQLLPKHFIKDNYLDYFFPEFGHIGMQPIDYREVCPLQQYGVNPNGLLDTFGYQRAWYDYIASVDEVHGLFRTNLRNFVLNRQFDTLPKLNKDFLQVDPAQLNDVFTVQDISDKILGQIHFNVIAKRPIPKFGIPRLE